MEIELMPTRNVLLTEHLDSFIASGVQAGRYTDAGEVIREGLRLLEQRDNEERAKIDWLRGAALDSMEAIERGEGKPFSSMHDLTEYLRHLSYKPQPVTTDGESFA